MECNKECIQGTSIFLTKANSINENGLKDTKRINQKEVLLIHTNFPTKLFWQNFCRKKAGPFEPFISNICFSIFNQMYPICMNIIVAFVGQYLA